MQDISWLLFILTSLAIIMTPGQDMILVMSRSMTQGTSAGIATAAGVSLGLLGHTILATLGLGALLQTSAWLFLILKLAGAAYLLYLGINLLRSPAQELALQTKAELPLHKLFLSGALSNISNPKIIVFYFAFLPQFIQPGASHSTLAIAALGSTFALLTFIIKAPVGYCAGRLSGWLQTRPAILSGIYRSSGVILIGLGIKLAFERRD